MKAFAAFWMRLLAFTLLVMIAGVFLIDRESPPKTGIGGDGVQSAGTLSPVYASPIQVKLVDLIPASLSGETNQDSEPFLAVQTANPQVMVASAFTPNPVSSSSNAPVYVSEDGGNSWVAARMVLARGHGVRDVASHPLNGRDGVQDPAIAAVFGNIDGCIATARNGIGSECRSDHDLWVGSLDSEERFAVLIGFAAETCGDEVHKLDLDRRSIDRA